MTEEELAKVSDYAHMVTRLDPNLDLLNPEVNHTPFARCLQDCLLRHNASEKLLLPDLGAFGNESVALFSDYAGDASPHYDTYSFLACSFNCLEFFQAEMSHIRARFRLGSREIAYKEFRGGMSKAVEPYLEALDNYVIGLVFNVIVEKSAASVFGNINTNEGSSLVDLLSASGLGTWKPKVAENLLRITHIAGFLTALLARDGQKVFWMTDNDSVAPPDRHGVTLQMFQRAISIYGPDRQLTLIGGALPFKDRSTAHLDLLSCADVSAGSLLSYMDKKRTSDLGVAALKPGADHVIKFLARTGMSLKKLSILIAPDEQGSLASGPLEFSHEEREHHIPIRLRNGRGS